MANIRQEEEERFTKKEGVMNGFEGVTEYVKENMFTSDIELTNKKFLDESNNYTQQLYGLMAIPVETNSNYSNHSLCDSLDYILSDNEEVLSVIEDEIYV